MAELLLFFGALDSLPNKAGMRPSQVSLDQNIKTLVRAAAPSAHRSLNPPSSFLVFSRAAMARDPLGRWSCRCTSAC